MRPKVLLRLSMTWTRLEKPLPRRSFYTTLLSFSAPEFENLRPSEPPKQPTVCRLLWDPEVEPEFRVPFPQMTLVTRGPKALHVYVLSNPRKREGKV